MRALRILAQCPVKVHWIDDGGRRADWPRQAGDNGQIAVGLRDAARCVDHDIHATGVGEQVDIGKAHILHGGKDLTRDLRLAGQRTVVDLAAQQFGFNGHAEWHADVFKTSVRLHILRQRGHALRIEVRLGQGVSRALHDLHDGRVHHAAGTDDGRTVHRLLVQNAQQTILGTQAVHGFSSSAAPISSAALTGQPISRTASTMASMLAKGVSTGRLQPVATMNPLGLSCA